MRGQGGRAPLEARVRHARRPLTRVVGIDLGTTNTAVAWAEPPAERIHVFEVPQLVAPGELAARVTLPSFVYLAGEHDLPEHATRLPWDPDARRVVGELAREQGARVPSRMIASSKSWLCHAGVDRHAAILPWGADDVPKRSPVDTAADLLSHVAAAWATAHGTPLAAEEVVVTVPASFDEVARELTVEAAARAGLTQITLVEEPQAVFYAWIDAHGERARREALHPGERVLVCDVGGGTTDFTLLEVDADGDGFTRTAVGDHLLLGGDNLDIALARKVEARLGKLDAVRWQGLVHACRLAKEQLLADPSLPSRTVSVATRGAKLVGGALKADLPREEVETLVLEGFFPRVARDARPERTRVGLQEFGLPFAADPAITRHLAAFLARHGGARVDAVLFSGGAMKPPAVRARVLELIGAWQGGAPPRELANDAPHLAVARGAAYYGLVRHGLGTRIRGGAARAYYVGVEEANTVCVLPRGADEGTEQELGEDLLALMNRPVSFRLYSTSGRTDQPGDVVQATELTELPPLVTVLRAPGRSEARVRLRARLTEIGTLELWCADTGSDARWRLSFDLRGGADDAAASVLDPHIDPARDLVRTLPLMKELERVLEARRDEWSTATNRALWDAVNEREAERRKSADAEARWLNLAGFLLRPGTGAPLDDWRGKEMWRLWSGGLVHDRDEATRLAWWIAWRRIAGGLTRGQQEQIHDRLAPLLLPGAQQKAKWYKVKPSPQEATEMWRVLASLEQLSPAIKTRLGDALTAQLAEGKKALGGCDPEVAFWALGRVGARTPLYAPADLVVSPETAARWIDRLLALDWRAPEKVAFPAAQLGRRTGDRARDIDDATRARLAERLRATPNGDRTARLVEQVVDLEAREERVAFGDSLPAGLRRAR